MSDETFNMSLRKFLKRVGVTSQQHIETAVRAQASGAISGGAVNARMVLTLEGVDGEHVVTREIELGDDA